MAVGGAEVDLDERAGGGEILVCPHVAHLCGPERWFGGRQWVVGGQGRGGARTEHGAAQQQGRGAHGRRRGTAAGEEGGGGGRQTRRVVRSAPAARPAPDAGAKQSPLPAPTGLVPRGRGGARRLGRGRRAYFAVMLSSLRETLAATAMGRLLMKRTAIAPLGCGLAHTCARAQGQACARTAGCWRLAGLEATRGSPATHPSFAREGM